MKEGGFETKCHLSEKAKWENVVYEIKPEKMV